MRQQISGSCCQFIRRYGSISSVVYRKNRTDSTWSCCILPGMHENPTIRVSQLAVSHIHIFFLLQNLCTCNSQKPRQFAFLSENVYKLFSENSLDLRIFSRKYFKNIFVLLPWYLSNLKHITLHFYGKNWQCCTSLLQKQMQRLASCLGFVLCQKLWS